MRVDINSVAETTMTFWGIVELEEEDYAPRAISSTRRKNVFRKRFCLLFTRTNSRANADCVALRFGQLVRVATRPDAHVLYRSFRPRKHAVTLPHLWNCVLSQLSPIETQEEKCTHLKLSGWFKVGELNVLYRRMNEMN